jgi:hypothetical protein
MSTKPYIGNGQATLDGCEASKDRDLRKELGFTNEWIEGKLMEQAAKLDKPVTPEELVKLVFDNLTPEEREVWLPEPHYLLYHVAYKGPISTLVGNGDLVRSAEQVKGQHPLIVRDKATLEDCADSLRKHLTPKRQKRPAFGRGMKRLMEYEAQLLQKSVA